MFLLQCPFLIYAWREKLRKINLIHAIKKTVMGNGSQYTLYFIFNIRNKRKFSSAFFCIKRVKINKIAFFITHIHT